MEITFSLQLPVLTLNWIKNTEIGKKNSEASEFHVINAIQWVKVHFERDEINNYI